MTGSEERRMRAHAVFLGERLDLRGLPGGEGCDMGPALGALPGVAVYLFRWGAGAIFGAEPADEAAILERLRPHVVSPVAAVSTELATVVIGTHEDAILADGAIGLRDDAPFRLTIVAEALAKSAALSHQETTLGRTLDGMEPVITRMRQRGRLAASPRRLIATVADAIWARNYAVARVRVDEKPDALWDHGELDRLNTRLTEEFELAERSAALDRKLALVGDTVQTLLALMESRRSLVLEVAVAVFIGIEVAATLWGLFTG
jgi:uncharacterized Rmd1/YagE family protein